MWLLFDFHENTNQRQHTKVHPPMLDGEASGVFATRCAGGFDISTFKTAETVPVPGIKFCRNAP